MVVTLTGGERGDILNPAMDLPEVHGRIHEIRHRRDGQGRRDPRRRAPLAGVRRLRAARGRPAAAAARRMLRGGAARAADRGAGPADPRVPAARHDHVRRERRLSRTPTTSGATRCRWPRTRPRPTTCCSPTPASRGACPSCTTTTASCGSGCRLIQDEFAKHGKEGPFAQVAEHWDPDTRHLRQAGDHAHRVLRVLRPARRRSARARHPDRPRRETSSPRPSSGSSGCGPPRSSSWPGRGCPSTCPRPTCSRGSSR